MSTKSRNRLSFIPIVAVILVIFVGLEFAISPKNYAFGWLALLVGLIALAFILLARRRSSTTFERILTISPRDERDERKIQWGFALVGQAALWFTVLLALGVLAIYSTNLPYDDCHMDGTGEVCVPGLPWYFLTCFEIVLGFFVLTFFIAAIVSSFKRD